MKCALNCRTVWNIRQNLTCLPWKTCIRSCRLQRQCWLAVGSATGISPAPASPLHGFYPLFLKVRHRVAFCWIAPKFLPQYAGLQDHIPAPCWGNSETCQLRPATLLWAFVQLAVPITLRGLTKFYRHHERGPADCSPSQSCVGNSPAYGSN